MNYEWALRNAERTYRICSRRPPCDFRQYFTVPDLCICRPNVCLSFLSLLSSQQVAAPTHIIKKEKLPKLQQEFVLREVRFKQRNSPHCVLHITPLLVFPVMPVLSATVSRISYPFPRTSIPGYSVIIAVLCRG
jgi:hypothetical protein